MQGCFADYYGLLVLSNFVVIKNNYGQRVKESGIRWSSKQLWGGPHCQPDWE